MVVKIFSILSVLYESSEFKADELSIIFCTKSAKSALKPAKSESVTIVDRDVSNPSSFFVISFLASPRALLILSDTDKLSLSADFNSDISFETVSKSSV